MLFQKVSSSPSWFSSFLICVHCFPMCSCQTSYSDFILRLPYKYKTPENCRKQRVFTYVSFAFLRHSQWNNQGCVAGFHCLTSTGTLLATGFFLPFGIFLIFSCISGSTKQLLWIVIVPYFALYHITTFTGISLSKNIWQNNLLVPE